MSNELHPGIWFTLWAREKRSGELVRRDTYDTIDVAIEMGRELLDQGFVEFKVLDAKGKTVQHENGD